MPSFDLRDNYDNLWDPQGNWQNQDISRLGNISTVVTSEQLNSFNEILNSGGIYDEGQIMRGKGGEDAMRRKQYQRYMHRKYARRLGPRAGGAAETMFANNFLAPQYSENVATRRNLRMRNADSILQALAMKGQLNETIIRQYLAAKELEAQDDSGFLDWAKLAVDAAARIPGPQQPAAAAASTAVEAK